MENKRVRKKNKKNSEVPMNSSSKILMLLSSILIGIAILLVLITFLIPIFSNFFWFNIRNPINDLLFYIFQYFPFITDHYLAIFISIILGLGVVVIILNYINVPKKKLKTLTNITNIFYKILIVVISLSIFQILFTLTDYNHANINTFYLKGRSSTTYSEDDIFKLLEELSEEVLSETKLLKRENGEVVVDKETLELVARKDLLKISDSYPFLKGSYPKKIKDIYNKQNVYGYTNSYSISTDNSINNVNYASVITHEYCHQKGILHESDAVYCAYLAGINSNSLISRYSAHLEALSWVMSVAERIDENKTNKIVEEILNLCLNDNYREVCDLQIKNIYKYQENSNIIVLSSYLLDSYNDHIDEFLSILDVYKEKYNALLLIDNIEVSLIDIRNSIVSDEKSIVNVIIDNEKKLFDNIEDYLKSSNRYFKSIRQKNSNYEEEEVPISYYIKPFSNEKLSFFDDEIYNDFSYMRVVRLLLEHRSIYGIE